MSAAQDLRRIAAKAQARYDRMKAGVITETFRSIVEGSELTGAPGQPIDKGKLHESWSITQESPTDTLIASDDRAAPAVEGNWGDVVYKNHGPHSRDLTVAGFSRIVDSEVKKVAND